MSAGAAHRLALLQKWESQLSPAQLDVWRTLMELLPKDSPLVGDAGGWGLEVSLMAHVKRGATVDDLRRYIPTGMRRVPDRRMLAANEPEAA